MFLHFYSKPSVFLSYMRTLPVAQVSSETFLQTLLQAVSEFAPHWRSGSSVPEQGVGCWHIYAGSPEAPQFVPPVPHPQSLIPCPDAQTEAAWCI